MRKKAKATSAARAASPGKPLPDPETVHLGSRLGFEDTHPAPPLRGLLPTPPEVERRFAEETVRLAAMSPRKRRLVRDDYCLSYFFGGREVAFRQTDQGIEVLAVGRGEIDDLKSRLTAGELLDVVEEQVRPW
jgi:hypothetical protein